MTDTRELLEHSGAGCIHVAGYERYDDTGTPEYRSQTTSFSVAHETGVMSSYLELERAQRLRGVNIEPYAIGSLIVVSPNVSIWKLVAGWWSQRSKARAAAAIGREVKP